MRIVATTNRYPEKALVFDKKNAAVSYSPSAFRDSYEERLSEEVTIRENTLPSKQSMQGQSLTSLFQLASQMLGPAQAVALGGEAMTFLASDQDLSDADTGMLRNVQAERSGTTSNGTALYLGEDTLTDYGLATTQSVVLPQGFEVLIGSATGDYIIGHEQQHVTNNDVIKKLGRKLLVGSLQDETLQAQAQDTLAQLEREMELEADRAGIHYALEQGHSEEKVRAGVSQFFAVTEAGDSDSHPARSTRLTNLETTLRDT